MSDEREAAMTRDTLISPSQLREQLDNPAAKTLVADCSFELADAAAGRRAYDDGHLPGAVYVHLEDVLSAAKTGRNGRHPLPERERFADAMAALGADDDTLVVGYDNAGGMYAARLWWMLRWAGHGAAAVLDGGIAAWRAERRLLAVGGPAARRRGAFRLRENLVPTADYAAVKANLDGGERLVLDARAPDRYRGENETLDPVGGHIPGAKSIPWGRAVNPETHTFRTAAELRTIYEQENGLKSDQDIIAYCRIGERSSHTWFVLTYLLGHRQVRNYDGSWTEWGNSVGVPIERP